MRKVFLRILPDLVKKYLAQQMLQNTHFRSNLQAACQIQFYIFKTNNKNLKSIYYIPCAKNFYNKENWKSLRKCRFLSNLQTVTLKLHIFIHSNSNSKLNAMRPLLGFPNFQLCPNKHSLTGYIVVIKDQNTSDFYLKIPVF